MKRNAPENRLAGESSPYLLQHARNPVEWYPWGDEALSRARDEDKPILLSIGYSACHWCHVMERESFEDVATAALMNENFVCIKVDREERPDLDMIYMNSVQIMTGSGGWPLNVFLTPSLKPFYGGTYFPPSPRHGLPAFSAVLERVAQAYRQQREKVAASGEQIAGYIAQMSRVSPSEEKLTDELHLAASRQFQANYDVQHGGWGAAPKFPQAHAVSLLLRIHKRLGNEEAKSSAEHTLSKMARGGMYDQLGGGFHRYSTDAVWLVPHFEKMLYDQAMLIPAYLEGYQVTGNLSFSRVARETLDYVIREMTSSEGGFFSAQDADSEGEEGKFFVWSPDEVTTAAGVEDGRRFCAYYDITPAGNWEGRSILHVPREMDEVAREMECSVEELEASLTRARSTLLRHRESRTHPGLDDKILTSWNGLMLSAMARGFQVLEDPRYLMAARSAGNFLLERMRGPKGALKRTYRNGVAKLEGCLDDYVFLATGLLDLYESDFDPRWFEMARSLLDTTIERFWDETNGAFFFTVGGQEDLIVRSKTGHDGALPSGNSMCALLLLRMARLTGDQHYADRAVRTFRAYLEPMSTMPTGFSQMLSALDFHLGETQELVLAGPRGHKNLDEMLQVIRQEFLPNKVVALRFEGEEAGDRKLPALLEGKRGQNGEPTAYICKNFQCTSPICDPAAFRERMSAKGESGRSQS